MKKYQYRITVLALIAFPVVFHWGAYEEISVDLRFFYLFTSMALIGLAGGVDSILNSLRRRDPSLECYVKPSTGENEFSTSKVKPAALDSDRKTIAEQAEDSKPDNVPS